VQAVDADLTFTLGGLTVVSADVRSFASLSLHARTDVSLNSGSPRCAQLSTIFIQVGKTSVSTTIRGTQPRAFDAVAWCPGSVCCEQRVSVLTTTPSIVLFAER
jgi:hypothetical protein